MTGSASLNERARKALAGRWRVGMLDATFGARIWTTTGDRHESVGPDGGDLAGSTEHLVPEMSDASTCGAFLAVVREAWSCPGANLRRQADPCPVEFRWIVCMVGADGRTVALINGSTEAEALVAALEAAPSPVRLGEGSTPAVGGRQQSIFPAIASVGGVEVGETSSAPPVRLRGERSGHCGGPDCDADEGCACGCTVCTWSSSTRC